MSREKEIREVVESYVLVNMSRGDIVDACRTRSIKVGKSRSAMETALIDAMVKEALGSEKKGDLKGETT